MPETRVSVITNRPSPVKLTMSTVFTDPRGSLEEGLLKPGDDLLFLVVAGDIREHVKATFAELLDRIKAEAVIKQEIHDA